MTPFLLNGPRPLTQKYYYNSNQLLGMDTLHDVQVKCKYIHLHNRWCKVHSVLLVSNSQF